MVANIKKHVEKQKLSGKFQQPSIMGWNSFNASDMINNMHKKQRTKSKRKK